MSELTIYNICLNTISLSQLFDIEDRRNGVDPTIRFEKDINLIREANYNSLANELNHIIIQHKKILSSEEIIQQHEKIFYLLYKKIDEKLLYKIDEKYFKYANKFSIDQRAYNIVALNLLLWIACHDITSIDKDGHFNSNTNFAFVDIVSICISFLKYTQEILATQ